MIYISATDEAASVTELDFFIIDENSGKLYLKKSLIDYPSPSLANFAVTCKDPANNIADETVVVKLRFNNTHTPSCSDYFFSATVSESIEESKHISIHELYLMY